MLLLDQVLQGWKPDAQVRERDPVPNPVPSYPSSTC